MTYVIDRAVADGDDIWVEAQSHGTLIDGQIFHNHHIFQFHLDGDRVADVREYMNPIIVEQKLIPLFIQLAKQSGQSPFLKSN